MHSINFKGFDFDFEVYHQPEEPQTYDYPGSTAYYEIYNITLNRIDASELLEDSFEEFEEKAIESLKNR